MHCRTVCSGPGALMWHGPVSGTERSQLWICHSTCYEIVELEGHLEAHRQDSQRGGSGLGSTQSRFQKSETLEIHRIDPVVVFHLHGILS